MDKVIISNNKNSIVISTLGAELKSFKKNDTEYIWCSDPKYWKRSAPFLFPIVGSLKNNKTIINEKEYVLTQHGFLRDQLFTFTTSENTVTLENSYNEETLKKYPFKYKAKVKYTLNDDELITEIKVTNNGTEDMPFNIGGHPAFNCPMFENDKFTDYTVYFEKEETFASPYVAEGGLLDFSKPVFTKKNLKELPLKKDLFTIDTILIPNVNSKKVLLLNKEKKGIEFSYPAFSTLAIWTPYNEAPFVCLEPWIGYNDKCQTTGKFLEKDDLIKLKASETYTVSYTIKLI